MFLINSAFVGKKSFVLIKMHGKTAIKIHYNNFHSTAIVIILNGSFTDVHEMSLTSKA